MRHLEGHLDAAAQGRLLAGIVGVIAAAPPFRPAMPRTGKPFSVLMTNCGPLGWVSDREGGYRYQRAHPATGAPWPAMPAMLLELWAEVAGYADPPEACLVNVYSQGARMSLHRDEDEADFAAPVVSISLGDACVFRIGGTARRGATRSVRLASGDVVLLEGASRLAYHGVDRIIAGTSTLLEGVPGLPPEARRINLTLRRVTRPAA